MQYCVRARRRGPSFLGPCWLHLGSNLAILAPTWGHVGSILVLNWPSWLQLDHLGAILSHVNLHLGASWLILSVVGTLHVVKNRMAFDVFSIYTHMLVDVGISWLMVAHLCLSGGHLGSILGSNLAILAPSWRSPGPC